MLAIASTMTKRTARHTNSVFRYILEITENRRSIIWHVNIIGF